MKKIKLNLLSSIFIAANILLQLPGVSISQNAGVGINSTGAAADASAILDASSTTRGLLIPRMTTAQRNAIVSPANSLLIYNTTSQCFEGYNASTLSWVAFGCLGCPGPDAPGVITGTGTVCQNTNGVSFSVSNVSGVSYTWTYSGTGFTISTGSGTSSISANFSASATSGLLTCTPSNACGNGTASTFTLTVNSISPTPGAITGNICISKPIVNVYYITPVSGAISYTWSVPSGNSISAGQGTNSITVVFVSSGSGNISVTANNPCSSVPSTLAVTVSFAEYSSPGTYSWLCPAGVTSVNVVCIGGGGGAKYFSDPVSDGGDSYFINTSTVCGRGGKAGGIGTGGLYTGDGGGNGGAGGAATCAGGGGAGGYTAAGGAGGTGGGNGIAATGGGGGGGGCDLICNDFGGGGGGTGPYGIGVSGAGGIAAGPTPGGGGGGSGGNNASNVMPGFPGGGAGGLQTSACGAGGGGLGYKNTIAVTPGNSYTVVVGVGGTGYSGIYGGRGDVFIMWCSGKTFPNN